MSIFERIPKEVIAKEFTHYGLFLGIVPVYVGDPEGECRVAVRNWWPDWLLGAAQFLLDRFATIGLVEYEDFMIKLTGEIPAQQGKGGE
ncbi:hypothetical protein ACLQ81_15295 [Bordetella avium]|uniref:hypothetical protein n=2 Tax=Bordetella avium TaxID=521 RepID=UPI000E0AC52D|nr:hypothetical protein [Bordetella avium]RIQ11803.1 hypothetical protein D0432_15260 [Bordetella avium]RIQ16277.1 hypothetical protein D0850_15175 [Bordetella avium]RIQ43684.1 hypothetical protein D0845_17845 [Bordetella avium]RIQ58455.1 hypothetical protein D0840_17120 [Bordetella avium]RIQ58921.1 hypothetical protein D0842_15450 [Bordetella avium]